MNSTVAVTNRLRELIVELEVKKSQDKNEKIMQNVISEFPDEIESGQSGFYEKLNEALYKDVIKCYKYDEKDLCVWRFFKSISPDQLSLDYEKNSQLELLEQLMRIYFFSDPLDDLTCLFIPIVDNDKIDEYNSWIKSYFYNESYPTSLLWLYALDSSLASLFPEEIIFIGKSVHDQENNILLPDFTHQDSIMIKRFSADEGDFVIETGKNALLDFKQIFDFLENEYLDRCLSHSGNKDEYENENDYNEEWKKFNEVLAFGVSDREEMGCISFSDLRASTKFLNTFGKHVYRNKIQQPFFERTKLISRIFGGRIDKFMGDNVMCVFLTNNITQHKSLSKDIQVVRNNFLSVYNLCRELYLLLEKDGKADSDLGLRSGISYGEKILRSNLGNEIVRDFTVTGETVNLAARLEHISIDELLIQNRHYFSRVIERFGEISELLKLAVAKDNLNPETSDIVREYTIYQNLISNLNKLEKIRFDIRLNGDFYLRLKQVILANKFKLVNQGSSELHGYEEFELNGDSLKFYFAYYNPKGFKNYEKIWILPLDIDKLKTLDLASIL